MSSEKRLGLCEKSGEKPYNLMGYHHVPYLMATLGYTTFSDTLI